MIARWKQDQSGQSMVEFALMFVSFMFVMAGIFDFSRAPRPPLILDPTPLT